MIREIFDLQNPWRKKRNNLFNLHKRGILPILIDSLTSKKIVGLLGSRQVGKSSLMFLLIQHLLDKSIAPDNIFYFNLDDLKLHQLFEDIPAFLQFVDSNNSHRKYIFIDEVQRLKNPGLFLKEVYDLGRDIKIIYSGSSQLEIKSKLKEHLVGRARQFLIHRLSFEEYLGFSNPNTRKQALEDTLIYGSYPGVVSETALTEKKLTIKDIYQSYVEKDLTDFLKIEHLDRLNHLLVLLANQIGNLLNIDGLSKALRISRHEVERVLNILEQTFIIKRIYPFFGNYKKEVVKMPKIYFLDLGLRNFILNNFNPLFSRNDQGDLFENFFLLEVLNYDYHGLSRVNFWRTTNQTEIDFIITDESGQRAVEVKWERKTIPKSFATLKKYYPEIKPRVVTHHNFL